MRCYGVGHGLFRGLDYSEWLLCCAHLLRLVQRHVEGADEAALPTGKQAHHDVQRSRRVLGQDLGFRLYGFGLRFGVQGVHQKMVLQQAAKRRNMVAAAVLRIRPHPRSSL